MQAEQRGTLAEMNLQKSRPLRGGVTPLSRSTGPKVSQDTRRPLLLCSTVEKTCIINWVPDTELRPEDVSLPDLRLCKRRTQGSKNL